MFDERKTALVAAYFLDRAGGSMDYLKLIKLMYLADRQSYADYGQSITGDEVYAMPNGPVLSSTLDLMKEKRYSPHWSELISRVGQYGVGLIREVTPSDFTVLSHSFEILPAVFEEFGNMDKWELVKHTHTLKEWKNPDDFGYRRIPIHPDDILVALEDMPLKDMGRLDAAFATPISVDEILINSYVDDMKACYNL